MFNLQSIIFANLRLCDYVTSFSLPFALHLCDCYFQGIPQGAGPQAAQPANPASGGASGGGAAASGASGGSGGGGGAMPAANPAAGGAAGMPQRLQQVIQQNPQLLAGVVAQLAQQNPQVWSCSISISIASFHRKANRISQLTKHQK